MKPLLTLIILMILGGIGHADSGGPYEGVPDVRATEAPPVFKIPTTKEPLEFYLSHMPRLAWNKKFNEPDSYTWEPIAGYHATFRILGHVRGHRILELRYVSRDRIAQGLDYADVLMLLAKGEDTGPDDNLCRAIYFTSGGVTYNHTAEYLPNGDKFGAVVVTRHYSGNGGHRNSIGIRGTQEFDFERFDPSKKNQNKPRHPTAISPQTEFERPSRHGCALTFGEVSSMRRNSTERMFQEWPGLRHVLHECAHCHAVGLKPGILGTKHGDYGMRQAIRGKFEELRIGSHGLCGRCAEESGVPK